MLARISQTQLVDVIQIMNTMLLKSTTAHLLFKLLVIPKFLNFLSLPVLLYTNTVSITYLSISISRYCFLLSQSHIFTFSHYGLTYPHAISYFMLHLHYPFMNKGTVVTEYYFISFC